MICEIQRSATDVSAAPSVRSSRPASACLRASAWEGLRFAAWATASVNALPPTGTARANLSPALPFFQLGLFYIVVPAMGIQGPVGQQLSYLAAAGVATGDFVLLLLLGYAFNHKERTRAFLHHLRNRRRRTA